jgi:thiamine-monophosphate kinase
MMDVTDGLGSDLRRIAKASRVGFDILADAIPISSAARRLSKLDGKSTLRHAWSDGEDFELLFTIDAPCADELLRRWYRRFSIPLAPIGTVTRSSGRIRLIGRKDEERLAHLRGYEHFDSR